MCGVATQGSTLGPLLFLICMNDMPQAVKSNLFLCAYNFCPIFRKRTKQLFYKQSWMINLVFSLAKRRLYLSFLLLNIEQECSKTKYHLQKYINWAKVKGHILSFVIDETISEESIALKVINKINSRLNFYIGKTNF